MTAEDNLIILQLQLPTPLKPFGVYRPCVSYRVGDVLHLSLSGENNDLIVGKCGPGHLTKEEGKHAAYLTALGCLATIRNQLGGLNRVKRVIKSLVMVNSCPHFQEQIFVANGFAEVFKDVFGAEAGVGARSAIGMGSLPMNQTVEVEMIVEVELAPVNLDLVQQTSLLSSRWLNIPELDSVINCCGHFTSLGGSRLHPRALEAMSRQSHQFVDLNALLQQAGERIATLVRAPVDYTAHVTSGAASGIALATVACMCRHMQALSLPLPRDSIESIMSHLPNMKEVDNAAALHHITVAKHVLVDGASDVRWLSQVQLTGARVAVITNMTANSIHERIAALGGSEQIACFLYFDGANPNGMTLESVVSALNHKIPLIVDAAARLPPINNLWRLAERGASAVLFSGGKAIRGPQSSGFMVAKRSIVDLVSMYACPREDSVCRAMKTTKESIVGLVAALSCFLEESSEYPRRPNAMAKLVQSSFHSRLSDLMLARVQTYLSSGLEESLVDVQPNGHNLFFIDMRQIPFQGNGDGERRSISMYGEGVNHGNPLHIVPVDSPTELAARLCRSAPGLRRIAINTTAKGIFVNPIVLQNEEEARYVGRRIADEITAMDTRSRL